MNKATLYLQHCKMTCLGGSERGTCGCLSPSMCKQREEADYKLWRDKADRRAMRRIRNIIRQPGETE